MKKNLNKLEIYVRISLGAIFILMFSTNALEDGFLENIILAFGLYAILTALLSYCLIYGFLGIDKTKVKNKKGMY